MGEKFSIEAEGILSVCIQHEIDHLDGKLCRLPEFSQTESNSRQTTERSQIFLLIKICDMATLRLIFAGTPKLQPLTLNQ